MKVCFFFFFFFSSLRMMTQMLEALLNISEWAGTSCSHLIELWRPLIPVHKTAWHTPELPLSHTRSSLRPCALMANHFEKQWWSFHFAFVQNEVTAWRQSWTPKSEILTSRKKNIDRAGLFLCSHLPVSDMVNLKLFCLEKLFTYQFLKVGRTYKKKETRTALFFTLV